jgi:hypothetical protein
MASLKIMHGDFMAYSDLDNAVTQSRHLGEPMMKFWSIERMFWSIVVSCLAVVLITGLIFTSQRFGSQRKIQSMLKPSKIKSMLKPSRFLYLLQTESCFPDHLKSDKAIGNTTSCQCDVLVLSFKQACDETSPAHVKYISINVPTTWNTGRNLLFEGAMKGSEKYLYYIFMDDDIDLQAKANSNLTNPWRAFENFLRRVEPAVGAVDMNRNQWVPRTYKARRAHGCGLPAMPEYMTVVYYDGAFNAFHYIAVEHILPYPSKYDNTSWWFSQQYIIIKSKVLFPTQSVTHTRLLAMNPKRRPYPRKDPDKHQFLDIINMVQADIPEWYQNSSLLVEWKVCGSKHETISSQITCLSPALPRTPIEYYGDT